MNFVTGKQIPRRAFVKGVGASMALPFLDAMIPAGRVWSKALPEADPTRVIAMRWSMEPPDVTSGVPHRTYGLLLRLGVTLT